eukprot:CAMPEP_0183742532 /NCGR_PEP_ID=MMETSP0737-20130205/64751_1 /TAXON_ID=385413 /ORGANISM="Thalassiosira miniscula, Strain CCMP1093" /LENGTH=235 /DNA_ID=CAMNT_0025978119 /DNA_START=129 /DNA_END=836 /DNA_ORIENTATION=+
MILSRAAIVLSAIILGFTQAQDCPSNDDGQFTMNYEPVTCGANSCLYDNQSAADAAGYTSDDCCNAVPDGVAVTTDYSPVTCGANSCLYNNPSEAEAAGATECCRAVPDGVACTANYEPVTCGADSCIYSNQCEADAAGATGCCRQPVTEGCTMDYEPVKCGANSCAYNNKCIAEASGFDPESCVPDTSAAQQTSVDPDGNNVTELAEDMSESNGLDVTIGLLVSASAAVLGMSF